MIASYIKQSIRSLRRHPRYTIINVTGFSVSLSAALIILLWCQDERGMDRFHDHGNHIKQLHMAYPEEGALDVNKYVAYPLLTAIEEEVPEVEAVLPLSFSFEQTISHGKVQHKELGVYGSGSLFSMFSFPVVSGLPDQLDAKTNSIAISASLAERLFGRDGAQQAIGQTIMLNAKEAFSVDLVFEDLPHNSSLQFDFVLNNQFRISRQGWLLDWGNKGTIGMLLLRQDANPMEALAKVNDLYRASSVFEEGEAVIWQDFADAYLFSQFDERAQATSGRIEYVRIFTWAALLLILMACINFINLATARASLRSKEVGVRKTIGASKKALVTQFLSESSVLVLFSVVVAVLITELLLPTASLLTGKQLSIDYLAPTFWQLVGALIVGTSLLAGIYPSLVMSSFKTAHVLRGRLAERIRGGLLRKGLVSIQFLAALLLVVGALIMHEQVQYILQKNLGLDRQDLLVIDKYDNPVGAHYTVIRDALERLPAIKHVTASSEVPTDVNASTGGVSWPGKTPDQDYIQFDMLWIESDFLESFDIPLVAGRFYHPSQTEDTARIVLNQKAIDVMNLTDPVGKTISWWGSPREVIGVVQDFHTRSLYRPIEPLGLILDQSSTSHMLVRGQQGGTAETIAALNAVFQRVIPDFQLDYEFADESFAQTYQGEMLTASLAKYFGIISLIISGLGLFGLSSFFASRRRKEIGIRKLLGASVIGITRMLSKDMLGLVALGLGVGLPISLLLLNRWLAKFHFHVDLAWWMFVAPVGIAGLTAMLAVGIQCWRAARLHPIESINAD